MKKLLPFVMLVSFACMVFAQGTPQVQNQKADIAPKSVFSSTPMEINPNNLPIPSLAGGARAVVLYDNGPLVNSPGTGAGGADESVVQTSSLGMNLYGFGFEYDLGISLADDFSVPPATTWTIESFEFFGYQTTSSTTSPFTDCYMQIWDGDPSLVTSTVIWGDFTTNRLTTTSFTNIYRVTETTPGSTARPIMRLVCSTPSLTLGAGTYWVHFAAVGSSEFGNEWAPPITITGQTNTGNAIQNNDGWYAAVDNGTEPDSPQGLPFIINGDTEYNELTLTITGPHTVLVTGSMDDNTYGAGTHTIRVAPDHLVELEAFPGTNFLFLRWDGDFTQWIARATSTENPITLDLQGDEDITPVFQSLLTTPLSNWAILVGIGLIVGFMVVRFRRVL